MKFPKKTRRFCPYCKKHTEQKIVLLSSTARRGTLRRGSISRAKLRGLGVGKGNLGKWGSKKAVTKFKRKTKTTKKANIMFTCAVCKKSKYLSHGIRTGKFQLEEKGATPTTKQKAQNPQDQAGGKK